MSDSQIQMIDDMAARFGYSGKSARSDLLAFLIVDAYRRDGYSNRWSDLRAKAARTLSALRNWPNALKSHEIKSVAFRGEEVSVTTTLSGEPYRIRLTDWEDCSE